MKRVIFSFCLLIFWVISAEAGESGVPLGLTWGATPKECSAAFLKAGFSVWDEKVPGFSDDEDQNASQLEKLGFTKMYFKNDESVPKMNVHILLYKNRLYSVVYRYFDASPIFKANVYAQLKLDFGENEEFADEGKGIFVDLWMTPETIIAFTRTKDTGNPYTNLTRLAYTDLKTKQKLGPGYP